ncbi:hypothetical protein ABZ912_47355 [Nonomuraea angiospora]
MRQIRRVAAHVLQRGGNPPHPVAERVPLPSRAHLAIASRVLTPDKASLG